MKERFFIYRTGIECAECKGVHLTGSRRYYEFTKIKHAMSCDTAFLVEVLKASGEPLLRKKAA